MKITIFSGNQPRHISLAKELGKFAEHVYFISEVKTVFPGKIDDFFKKSDVMQSYFASVLKSERRLFGDIGFLETHISTLSIKIGDLNLIKREQLKDALNSDLYVVFGSSYIKGWLLDFLVQNNAINIHMGLSPYYRGSSCNFWALYDDNPSYVGATIHRLSKGLDSGEMLFHCLPKLEEGDTPFDFTMRSVVAAHKGLCQSIQEGNILTMKCVKQDKAQELRYTRNSDFTNEIVSEFLGRSYSVNSGALAQYPQLVNPIFV
ncbi:formyltransferase family protein [Alphaproteobacteria bacterium LSUCC0719]